MLPGQQRHHGCRGRAVRGHNSGRLVFADREFAIPVAVVVVGFTVIVAPPHVAGFQLSVAAAAAPRVRWRPVDPGRADRGHRRRRRPAHPGRGPGLRPGPWATGPGLGQEAPAGRGGPGRVGVGRHPGAARPVVAIGGAGAALRPARVSARRGGRTMTSAITQPGPAEPAGLTVRTFLLGSGPEDDEARIRHLLAEHDVVAGAGGDLTRLTDQGRAAVEEQLAAGAAGLLDLDLGDLLIYGWRTSERVLEAARQTRQEPGRREVVQLGTQRVTSEHHPTVELLVDGVKVHTFRFQLTVTFDIEVAALVIQNGRLTALKAGDCVIIVTLTLEMPGGDADLIHQRRKLSLPPLVRLGPGIPLVPAGD